MRQQQVPAQRYFARHVETRIRKALADTRIVALVGPRQAGKSFLAQRIADADGRRFLSLDDEDTRELASDPVSFMRSYHNGAVIDEIQRQPKLILALKRDVDANRQPGRWLITGSVDLFKSAITPDSLAGRIEVIELLPLSQAESQHQAPGKFLKRAFACDFPGDAKIGFTDNLSERVATGGYPDVLLRANMQRRQERLHMYAQMLTMRFDKRLFALPISMLWEA
ncbi:MAG: AAA family ATPase [Betaproteobacteria bacterium]|nr:AAA family ATPase [Betaproteobacteria bacterium]